MGSPTSNPNVNIQLLEAAIVDAFEERFNLIVGQTGSTGNATDGELYSDVQLMTDAQIKALFGSDELYWRIWSWREAVNVSGGGRLPKLYVIGKDANGSGVAAAGSHAITGTATGSGTLTFSVVDERKFTVNVNVTTGDTATEIGDAVVAAFGNIADLPFTPANSTGTVTYTTDDVGTIGNFYGLKVTGAVAGISIATTAFASGANDPSLTGVLDPIEGIRMSGISWPENWKDDINIPGDELDSRFNASNNILDGVVFMGRSLSFANAKSEVSTLNNQSIVIGGNNKLTNQPAILQPADWAMSDFMGQRAKRLTTGAQIARNIISTDGPLDAIGGPALASKPYFNTPLRNVPVTPATNLYSGTEQLELEDAGFTTFGVNSAGNAMLMGPVVTTRTTDEAGNVNDSFHYLNYVDTGSVCREIIFRVFKATFSQSRLTQGDLIAGRSIENTISIKSKLLEIYSLLASLSLTQSGTDAVNFFSENTTVTVTGDSLSNRSVTIVGQLPIVTQLGTINYSLALNFNVNNSGLTITV